MTAVITAIVAAFLAGGIALYRELRLELRRLLVAARILRALFQEAAIYADIFAGPDADYDSTTLEALSGMLDVPTVWAEHREVLAGQLTRRQWNEIAVAVATFEIVTLTDNRPSTTAPDRQRFADASADLQRAVDVLDPYCNHAGILRNPGRKTPVPDAPPEDSANPEAEAARPNPEKPQEPA